MKNKIIGSLLLLLTMSCGKTIYEDEIDFPYVGISAQFIDAVTYEKLPGIKMIFAEDESNNSWTVMDSATADSEGMLAFSGSWNFHNYCLLYKQDYLPTLAFFPGLNKAHTGPIPEGWEPALMESAGLPGNSGTIWTIRVHKEAFLEVDVNVVNPLPTPGKYFLELELRGKDSFGTTLYWRIYEVSSSYEILPTNNKANLRLAGSLTYNAKMMIYNELPDGSVVEVKSITKTITVKPKENNQVQFDF